MVKCSKPPDKARWRHASNHPDSSRCLRGWPKDLQGSLQHRPMNLWSPDKPPGHWMDRMDPFESHKKNRKKTHDIYVLSAAMVTYMGHMGYGDHGDPSHRGYPY